MISFKIYNEKKIVVFGGSGFLGSHVADFLTRKKYQVLIYDKVKSDYITSRQNFVQGDTQDIESVNKALKKQTLFTIFLRSRYRKIKKKSD